MILFVLLMSLLLKGFSLVMDKLRTTYVLSLNGLKGLVIAVEFFLLQCI